MKGLSSNKFTIRQLLFLQQIIHLTTYTTLLLVTE